MKEIKFLMALFLFGAQILSWLYEKIKQEDPDPPHPDAQACDLNTTTEQATSETEMEETAESLEPASLEEKSERSLPQDTAVDRQKKWAETTPPRVVSSERSAKPSLRQRFLSADNGKSAVVASEILRRKHF